MYFRNRGGNRNQDRGGNRNQDGNGIGSTGSRQEAENRRRFQSGGGGGGAPRRESRPVQSQGRPLPPQEFNVPDGARPININ